MQSVSANKASESVAKRRARRKENEDAIIEANLLKEISQWRKERKGK